MEMWHGNVIIPRMSAYNEDTEKKRRQDHAAEQMDRHDRSADDRRILE